MKQTAIFEALAILGDELVTISYVSKARQEIGILALMNLLDTSANRNEDNHVTGVLLFDKGKFAQILEGRASYLISIWQSILRDMRHTDIELLDFQKIAHRNFENWSMAFYGSEDVGKYIPELKTTFKDLRDSMHPRIQAFVESIAESQFAQNKQ